MAFEFCRKHGVSSIPEDIRDREAAASAVISGIEAELEVNNVSVVWGSVVSNGIGVRPRRPRVWSTILFPAVRWF